MRRKGRKSREVGTEPASANAINFAGKYAGGAENVKKFHNFVICTCPRLHLSLALTSFLWLDAIEKRIKNAVPQGTAVFMRF